MTKQEIVKVEGREVLVITHEGQEPMLLARGASRKWGFGNVRVSDRQAVLAILAAR